VREPVSASSVGGNRYITVMEDQGQVDVMAETRFRNQNVFIQRDDWTYVGTESKRFAAFISSYSQ